MGPPPPLNHDQLPGGGDDAEAGNGGKEVARQMGSGRLFQHMGPRGRKESGPGEGEGAQACGDGPRSRHARRYWGGRVNGMEWGGGNPPRWGRKTRGRPGLQSPQSQRRAQHAERLAQGRPLMAPHVSDTFPIFLISLTILTISPFLGVREWVGSLEDTAVPTFQPRGRGPREIIHLKCVVRARVPTHAFI